MVAKDLFVSPNAYATPMFAWMLNKYGVEVIQWDPATVQLQLKDDLGVDVPGYNLDKIHAACTLLGTNLFHVSLETFNNICLAFTRGVVSGQYMIPANAFDILWGVTEAKILEGADMEVEGFGHNIALYAGLVLDQAGLYEPIKMLGWAEYGSGRKEAVYSAIADNPDDYELYQSRQQDMRDALNEDIQKKMVELFTQIRDLQIPGSNAKYLEAVLGKIQG